MVRRILALGAAALLLAACVDYSHPTAKGPIPPPPPWLIYSVNFDTNSSRPDSAAMDTLAKVADAYRASGATKVTLTGHTDTVGSAPANLALSQQRAEAVKKALIALGVPAVNISTAASGEDQLPVKTADDVPEMKNRSVDISVR